MPTQYKVVGEVLGPQQWTVTKAPGLGQLAESWGDT